MRTRMRSIASGQCCCQNRTPAIAAGEVKGRVKVGPRGTDMMGKYSDIHLAAVTHDADAPSPSRRKPWSMIANPQCRHSTEVAGPP